MKCPYSRQEARAVIDLFNSAISELDAALQAAAQRETALEYELNCLRGSDKLEEMRKRGSFVTRLPAPMPPKPTGRGKTFWSGTASA